MELPTHKITDDDISDWISEYEREPNIDTSFDSEGFSFNGNLLPGFRDLRAERGFASKNVKPAYSRMEPFRKSNSSWNDRAAWEDSIADRSQAARLANARRTYDVSQFNEEDTPMSGEDLRNGIEEVDETAQEVEEPLIEGEVVESGSTMASGAAGMMGGAVASAARSATTSYMQNQNLQNEIDILNNMPNSYSFQNTDKNTRKQAIDTFLQGNNNSENIFNSVRGGIVDVAQLFGPEIGLPIAALDATLGNVLDYGLFNVGKEQMENIPYQHVQTFGDFGSSINKTNGQPNAVVNSVQDTNGS